MEFDEFKPGSYLASASIENSQSESDGQSVAPYRFMCPRVIDVNIPRGLVFVSSASEGAILTMPEGAVAFDLDNTSAFRDYVAANVEKWYKYVNGVRGREAKNGDVRLVIGCDKTTSWGMASLANVTQHKVCQLKFRATGDSNANSTKPSYTWDYSGMAEVRVGPEIKEINALRNSDDPFDATPPSDEEFRNQCLFIRTLNATLNDEAWKELHKNIGSTNVLDSSPSSRTILPETPPRSQRSTFNTSFNTPQSSPDRTNFGNQRSPTRLTQGFRVCIAFSSHCCAHYYMVHSSTTEELSTTTETQLHSDSTVLASLLYLLDSPTLALEMMPMEARSRFLSHQRQW